MTRSRKSVSEFQSSDQMLNLQASAFQWPVRKLKNRCLQLKESEKSVEPVHDNLKNTRILDQKDSETDSQRLLKKKRKSVNKQRIKSASPSDPLCSEVDVQDHVSKQLSSASTISDPLVQSEFDSPAAGIDSTMPRKRARKVKTERPVATEVEKSPAESNTAGENEVRTTSKKKHTEPGSLAPPPGWGRDVPAPLRGSDSAICAGWRRIYDLTVELRKERDAPVDWAGSESLGVDPTTGQLDRYHVLIALMLSSQTKDQVVAEAMAKLRAKGLSVEAVLRMSDEELNACIAKVGFHNNKTRYIKAATAMLKDRFGGTVPATAEELCQLPGVRCRRAWGVAGRACVCGGDVIGPRTLPPSLPPSFQASLPACLPACLPPCLPARLPPSLRPSVPPFLPPSLRPSVPPSVRPPSVPPSLARSLARSLTALPRPPTGTVGG